MRLEHVAIWTRDLERLRAFYVDHLGARAGGRYENARSFSSYFLVFDGGARLELMSLPELGEAPADRAAPRPGIAHLAFEVGDEAAVDALTERLRAAGCRVVGLPRRTGDGYYESVALDPDGNVVELTAVRAPG
jgi:lactoylglutathione lyase